MKRRIVPLLLIVICAVVLFYLLFVQHEFKKIITLKLPIQAVTEQFNTTDNLQKWFLPFVTATNTSDSITEKDKSINYNNYRLEVINQSIYSSLLKFSNGEKKKEFLVTALPDTSKGGFTTVSILYKNSYLKEWLFKSELEKKALNSFKDFTAYLDDTKRMYGYEIKPVKVTDTLFLFERKTVPSSEKRNGIKSIFENLIAYAAKNNLEYNGNRIFYFQESDDDITLYASIGIAREITIPENSEFEIKRMPFDKNLLEATYQGAFGESNEVFNALEKFISDHYLGTMGIPFQKFISDGFDFADDQVVQMKIYYPIL